MAKDKTKTIVVKIPETIYNELKDKTKFGKNISDVIREAIELYLEGGKKNG